MKNLKLISLYATLLIYYFFFWEEKLGLNLFIFNSIIIGLVYQNLPKKPKSYFVLAMPFISSLSVLLINTSFNKTVNLLTLAILFGYIHLPNINSSFAGVAVFIQNLFKSLVNFLKPFKIIIDQIGSKNQLLYTIIKYLKISVLPLIIFFIFSLIFNFANPIFEEKTSYLFNKILNIIKNFPNFSLSRFIFLIFGYWVLLSVFYDKAISKTLNIFTQKNEQIENTFEEIKNEKFNSAVFTFSLINLLLFYINSIDIQYLWMNYANSSAPAMSKLVHSGTYLLIFSILLSVTILIFYFKGELNFHKKSKSLKVLSILWIFQNCVLLLSVFIRNAKYLEMYGLTYKRIGVVIFLLLTFSGLISLTFKILKTYNFGFILRTNSWSYVLIFIILGFVNFDYEIAKYNLKQENKDFEYIENLSIRALPALMENHPEYSPNYFNKFDSFEKQNEKYTWLSWNLQDYKLTQKLKSQIK
jgi:hypothetical protein